MNKVEKVMFDILDPHKAVRTHAIMTEMVPHKFVVGKRICEKCEVNGIYGIGQQYGLPIIVHDIDKPGVEPWFCLTVVNELTIEYSIYQYQKDLMRSLLQAKANILFNYDKWILLHGQQDFFKNLSEFDRQLFIEAIKTYVNNL